MEQVVKFWNTVTNIGVEEGDSSIEIFLNEDDSYAELNIRQNARDSKENPGGYANNMEVQVTPVPFNAIYQDSLPIR